MDGLETGGMDTGGIVNYADNIDIEGLLGQIDDIMPMAGTNSPFPNWNESEKKENTAHPMKNLSNFYLLLWDLTLIVSALCITLNEIFFCLGLPTLFIMYK